MDIKITNVSGWTTITVKGKEISIRQKQKDFLKDNFNIILESQYRRGTYKSGSYIDHEITHDSVTLSPKQEQEHKKYDLIKQKYIND